MKQNFLSVLYIPNVACALVKWFEEMLRNAKSEANISLN